VNWYLSTIRTHDVYFRSSRRRRPIYLPWTWRYSPGSPNARDFVHVHIDAGNAQNALLLAAGLGDVIPAEVFVRGGRWLSEQAFVTAAAAKQPERALTLLAAALAGSPLASALPAAGGEAADLDRLVLIGMLRHLTRAARLEPLSTAPVLRVLLLIDAQSRDLRALAWGAEMRSPAALRTRQLVTPR
jgi:hypothetical protein